MAFTAKIHLGTQINNVQAFSKCTPVCQRVTHWRFPFLIHQQTLKIREITLCLCYLSST